MKKLVLLSFLALSACGGVVSCPPPAIEAKVVVDKQIVSIPCVLASQIAAEPPHVKSQLTQKSGHDLLIMDQSALDLRNWGEGMYAQLIGCSTSGPMPTNLVPDDHGMVGLESKPK